MSNYFTLTKNGAELELNAYSNGIHIGSLNVRSGLPHRQTFRTRANEVTGNYEPVPEGVYDLGALEWAGGQGNYQKLWPNILSPIWITIIGYPRYIGFHLDAGVEGTAGCVGFKTMQDLKTFVNWINGYGHFSQMYIDWGLGSVKLPSLEIKKNPEATATLKYKNKEVTIVLQNGQTVLTANDLRAVGIGVRWDYKTRTSEIVIKD